MPAVIADDQILTVEGLCSLPPSIVIQATQGKRVPLLFEGTVSGGQRIKGRLSYHTKDSFEGDFVHDSPSQGTVTYFNDAVKYTGAVTPTLVRHGRGVLTWGGGVSKRSLLDSESDAKGLTNYITLQSDFVNDMATFGIISYPQARGGVCLWRGGLEAYSPSESTTPSTPGSSSSSPSTSSTSSPSSSSPSSLSSSPSSDYIEGRPLVFYRHGTGIMTWPDGTQFEGTADHGRLIDGKLTWRDHTGVYQGSVFDLTPLPPPLHPLPSGYFEAYASDTVSSLRERAGLPPLKHFDGDAGKHPLVQETITTALKTQGDQGHEDDKVKEKERTEAMTSKVNALALGTESHWRGDSSMMQVPVRHGQGSYSWAKATKTRFEGIFVRDKVREGELTEQTGDIYYGPFDDKERKHGPGYLHLSQRSAIVAGVFVAGALSQGVVFFNTHTLPEGSNVPAIAAASCIASKVAADRCQIISTATEVPLPLNEAKSSSSSSSSLPSSSSSSTDTPRAMVGVESIATAVGAKALGGLVGSEYDGIETWNDGVDEVNDLGVGDHGEDISLVYEDQVDSKGDTINSNTSDNKDNNNNNNDNNNNNNDNNNVILKELRYNRCWQYRAMDPDVMGQLARRRYVGGLDGAFLPHGLGRLEWRVRRSCAAPATSYIGTFVHNLLQGDGEINYFVPDEHLELNPNGDNNDTNKNKNTNNPSPIKSDHGVLGDSGISSGDNNNNNNSGNSIDVYPRRCITHFIGQLQNGVPRQGTVRFSLASQKQGQPFRLYKGLLDDSGRLTGRGDVTFVSGASFSGQLERGKLVKGVYTHSNGTRFDGDFNCPPVRPAAISNTGLNDLGSLYLPDLNIGAPPSTTNALTTRPTSTSVTALPQQQQQQYGSLRVASPLAPAANRGVKIELIRVFGEGTVTFPDGSIYHHKTSSPDSFVSQLGKLLNEASLDCRSVTTIAKEDLVSKGMWPLMPPLSTHPRLLPDLSTALEGIQSGGGELALDELQDHQKRYIADMHSLYTEISTVLSQEEEEDKERRDRFGDLYRPVPSRTITEPYWAKHTEAKTMITDSETREQSLGTTRSSITDMLQIIRVSVAELEQKIRMAEEASPDRQALSQLLIKQAQLITSRAIDFTQLKTQADGMDIVPLLVVEGSSLSLEKHRNRLLIELQPAKDKIAQAVSQHKDLLQEIASAYESYARTLPTVNSNALNAVQQPLEEAVVAFTRLHHELYDAVKTAASTRDTVLAPLKQAVDTYVRERYAERRKQVNTLLLDELHTAVSADDKHRVDVLLHKTKDKIDVNEPVGPKGVNAITIAVRQGLVDMVVYLNECGAILTHRDADSRSLARIALDEEQVQCLGALVERGYNLDRREDEVKGTTLLHIYASKNNYEAVKLLLHHKASLSAVCSLGRTSLLHACATGANETVRLLIDVGSSPNWRDIQGNSPLHLVEAGEARKYLCFHGSRPNAPKNQAGGACCLSGEVSALKSQYQSYQQLPPIQYTGSVVSSNSRDWVDDKASETCLACGVKFGFFTRRHHCRVSGLLVCDDCSDKRVIHNGDKIRVCDAVYNKLRSDQHPNVYGTTRPNLLDKPSTRTRSASSLSLSSSNLSTLTNSSSSRSESKEAPLPPPRRSISGTAPNLSYSTATNGAAVGGGVSTRTTLAPTTSSSSSSSTDIDDPVTNPVQSSSNPFDDD